jgi:hypothetical protein
MSNIRNLLEKMDQFAGQAVGQKPGDQVRGTDKATRKKSGEHPFKGRLVGASESTGSLLRELQQELNKPEATVRRDLFREFAEYRQDVAEEDAWHSSEDAPQDAWHSSEDAPQDAWHGETSESQNNPADAVSMDIPLLIRIMEYAREDAQTDQDLHNVAERLIAMGADGNTLGMDQYDAIVGQPELDEEIVAPATPGVAPTAPAANTASNPAAVAQMKAQQLKTLAAQKKSTQDQIKQTQEQLDALRKQLASLSNPANVAMPSVTGTV